MFNNGTRNQMISSIHHINGVVQLTSTNSLRNGYSMDFIVKGNLPNTSKSTDPTLIVSATSDSETSESKMKVPEGAVLQVCTFLKIAILLN